MPIDCCHLYIACNYYQPALIGRSWIAKGPWSIFTWRSKIIFRKIYAMFWIWLKLFDDRSIGKWVCCVPLHSLLPLIIWEQRQNVWCCPGFHDLLFSTCYLIQNIFLHQPKRPLSFTLLAARSIGLDASWRSQKRFSSSRLGHWINSKHLIFVKVKLLLMQLITTVHFFITG